MITCRTAMPNETMSSPTIILRYVLVNLDRSPRRSVVGHSHKVENFYEGCEVTVVLWSWSGNGLPLRKNTCRRDRLPKFMHLTPPRGVTATQVRCMSKPFATNTENRLRASDEKVSENLQ